MKGKMVAVAAAALILAMVAQAQTPVRLDRLLDPASGPASRPGPGMHGGPGMMGGGPGAYAGAGPAWKPEMIKATYLGVGVAPTDPALREQLSLPEGVGLLVGQLDAEGPAKAAGVERLDVLHKFNDQFLINPEQLKVLVRISKPGEEVKLTVIRKAKPQVITVKLVEKEMPKEQPMMHGMMGGEGMMGPMGMPGGMNPEAMERMMREQMERSRQMPGMTVPGGMNPKAMEHFLREQIERSQQMPGRPGWPAGPGGMEPGQQGPRPGGAPGAAMQQEDEHEDSAPVALKPVAGEGV